MVEIKNTKCGFSLAEALISMLILSLFFIATSKIMTTKPKAEISENKHGYFECYHDGTNLKQKRSDGSYAGAPINVSECSFIPPKGIAFANIYVLNTTGIRHFDDDGEPVLDEDGNIERIHKERRFYVGVEPQFSGNADVEINDDTIKIDQNLLYYFQDELYEAGEGDININALINFFATCHPSSSIYALLQSDPSYAGPAVFIGW